MIASIWSKYGTQAANVKEIQLDRPNASSTRHITSLTVVSPGFQNVGKELRTCERAPPTSNILQSWLTMFPAKVQVHAAHQESYLPALSLNRCSETPSTGW